jgi:pyridoxal 5'-phosphate synthase pdxT subunit
VNALPARPRIGVLAVQGAFAEHRAALAACGADSREIRVPADLEGVDGLVLPGGESTTLGLLAEESGLLQAVRDRLAAGMAALGTCAGMIMLARAVVGGAQPLVGGMDIEVRRNAFGRQRASFEAPVPVPAFGDPPVDAVFIRAPWIESAGPGVEILAEHDGHAVAARCENLMVTAFHPELGDELRFHQWLVQRVRERGERTGGVERREGHVRAQ